MTTYNVHIYREMRLVFEGIEAETHEAAAAIARGKPTSDADEIDDCDGDTFYACADVRGDDDYEQSRWIDFEPERARQAASNLPAALAAVLPYASNERVSLRECWQRDDDPRVKQELEACDRALDQANAAIAEAGAAGLAAGPSDIDIHALLSGRRQIADIWDVLDVRSVRPDLSDDQAWIVLQAVQRRYDAAAGVNWSVLERHAEMEFGAAPDAGETERD